MADAPPPKLTVADQAFINAMVMATAPAFGSRDQCEIGLEAVRDLMARVNPNHPRLKRLVRAAVGLLSAERMDPGRERTKAQCAASLRAHEAVVDVAAWRFCEAMKVLERDEKGRAA